MNRTELRYKKFLEDCRDNCNGRKKLSLRELTVKHGVNNNLQTALHKAGAIAYKHRRKPIWTGKDDITYDYVKLVMSETAKYQNDPKGYPVSIILKGSTNGFTQATLPLDCRKRNKVDNSVQKSKAITVRLLWGLFEYSKG